MLRTLKFYSHNNCQVFNTISLTTVHSIVCFYLPGVAARLGNVFEGVLPEEYHEVFHIKKRLMELSALNAAMSGSGPTVFGVFAEQETARRAAEVLKETYQQTYLAMPVKKF